jgi:GT2 family glycosyltransferase
MTSLMVATPPPSSDRAAPPVLARVVVAVLWVDGEGLAETLAAVGRQVYEVAGVVIVGGPEEPGASTGVGRTASFASFVSELGPEIDLVWVLHGDARPRPDALGALVEEAERNAASLVGSKVLDTADPTRLESVGTATDVFGEPYSGLDPGEVDLEQYDVIRDVAFVSGVSMLVRRDLLKGLRGPDPLLPPVAAGMDLSQRARIAGSRVMVVPSSEVLHARRCGHDVASWRELAGRQRAMLKAYRWVSLAWVVSIGTLVALADGLLRLLMGRPGPLLDFLRSVAWNALHLPSLVTSRRALNRVRASRDEELFRYQVAGSLRLRSLFADLGERLGLAIDAEPGIEEEAEEEETRLVGPIVAALALLVVGLATRRLWLGGPPVGGFSLPASAEPLSVLRSWAGGWNPAGLGSAEPLHPAPATVAAIQLLLGGWSGAQGLIGAASMVLGVLGTGRLLARVGVTGPSRHLAGAVLLLGPFAARLGAGSSWAGLVALGALPWLVDAVIAPWPLGRRRQAGRLGVLVVGSALVAGMAPLALLVSPAAGVLAWALVPSVGRGAVLRGLTAPVFGALLVSPYLLAASWDRLTSGGATIDLRPGRTAGILLVVAALAATLSAPPPRRHAAGWGGAMAALAAAGALPGVGGEAAIALAALGSLGAAVAVGAALPIESGGALRAALGGVSSVASMGLVVLAAAALPAGRAWLPADRWSGTLEFVASLAPPTGPDRALLLGPAEELPGESRSGDGFSYRLVWGSVPTLDQAWLNDPLPGDGALAAALSEAQLAVSARPGALLAPFAVRWLVVLDGVPVTAMLDAQVDLAELPVAPGVRVFENLAVRPRVEAPAWSSDRVEASGVPFDGPVRLADNAAAGWRPGGRAVEWYTVADGSEGELWYRPDSLRLVAAWVSLGLLVGGTGLALWGRR